jgi:hypothetical protein
VVNPTTANPVFLTMANDAIRCPGCHGLDWTRDGFRIRELHHGDVERRRVAPPLDGAGPWICGHCRYRAPVWGYLAAKLNAAQAAAGGVPH